MTDIASALRRIITGENADGRSVVIVDGGPSATNGGTDLGGLFEIWHDVASGPLDPQQTKDLGPSRSVLSPASGHVKVRWFMIQPTPEGVPRETVNKLARERFASFDAEDHLTDQSRHPGMHLTETLDVICLLKGEASLVLDDTEHRMKQGQVVIQRGTSHAWIAHGGPALFLAVLIDRPVAAAR